MGEDIFCDNKGEPIAAQEQKISIDIGEQHIADFCQLCAGELAAAIKNCKTNITNARKKAQEPEAPDKPAEPAAETPATPEQPAATEKPAAPVALNDIQPATPEQSAEEIAATPGGEPNAKS